MTATASDALAITPSVAPASAVTRFVWSSPSYRAAMNARTSSCRSVPARSALTVPIALLLLESGRNSDETLTFRTPEKPQRK
jgi:hypothetical protein